MGFLEGQSLMKKLFCISEFRGFLKSSERLEIVAFTCVIFAFINFFTILILGRFVLSKPIDKLGAVGDFFGGTTVSLLTLATFLLLVSTLKIQKKELKNQTIEFEKSNSLSQKISIENTFFNMLKYSNDFSKDSVFYGRGTEDLIFGRRAFKFHYESLQFLLEKIDKNDNDQLKKINMDYFKDNAHELMTYFQTLDNIVRYIAMRRGKELIDEEDEMFYLGVLQNNFDPYEKRLFYYYITYINAEYSLYYKRRVYWVFNDNIDV